MTDSSGVGSDVPHSPPGPWWEGMSQAEIEDWWFANEGFEWQVRMQEHGYAICDHTGDFSQIEAGKRMAILAETRWDRWEHLVRNSRLWDTPLTKHQRKRLDTRLRTQGAILSSEALWGRTECLDRRIRDR